MKTYTTIRARFILGILFFFPFVILNLTGCATLDPRQVDVDPPNEMPEVKETNFDKPLADLGKMTQVYGKRVFIQGKDITDYTGLSTYGFGEIPRDITEMTKSALNAIGGNVVYIPYTPVYINNQMVTGYSNFQGKLIPDIVLSGGITEFDRGLETRGSNTDFGVTTNPFNVNRSWVPGDVISVDYNQEDKDSLARITLDFNLLDFQTMAGVARMQTVNSINVYKAAAEKELGFTIFGPTFGLRGTVKKIQGRHAAIRLLVQTSVLQIVGKYLHLPYWKLIPEMQPDQVVLDKIRQDFRYLSQADKIGEIQTCLYLKGYDVPVTGQMDAGTQAALNSFKMRMDDSRAVHNDTELYVELWSSLGENMEQVAYRREMLARAFATDAPVQRVAAAPAKKATTKTADKVASDQPGKSKATPKKEQREERTVKGPTAVAKAPVTTPAAKETDQTTKNRDESHDIVQVLRPQPILGNKSTAEALINERRTAE